jgi:transposase InsO family protein
MQELSDHDILASMGAVGNCYDNAFAERLIGILKDEYLLDVAFESLEQMALAVEEVVVLYNTDRPHLSLDMAVPAEVYNGYCLETKAPNIAIPAEEVVET